MAYVAARGGEEAIKQSEHLYQSLKAPVTRELVERIETSLPYLVDRVMGEASIYAPKLAALALAQTGGDTYEAVLLLRAYRSTQPRLAYAETVTEENMTILRRISASFKDIPGGQILGPTLDYSHRLLNLDVLDEEYQPVEKLTPADHPSPKHYPYVSDWQRGQGMVDPKTETPPSDPGDIPDLTRGPLHVPAPRATRLQALSRADTGGILSLGYANMRGYGGIHPTVNEVRQAHAEVRLKHPITGQPFTVGKIRTSQAEIITRSTKTTEPSAAGKKEKPNLELGFAATMGWNEVKVIAASMLDRAMDTVSPHPAHTEDFVLYHTEGVEASGFCIHFKLPHYVTFSSSLDAYKNAMVAMGWVRAPEDGGVKRKKGEEK